jgi:hypothetical protein
MPTDPKFRGTSYLDRYQIALERLRLEGDMDAVCLFYTEMDLASVEYPTRR